MRRLAVAVITAAVLLVTAAPAAAQGGHFFNPPTPHAPECVQVGDTVVCTGRIAGLRAGTTFTVEAVIAGTAEVGCRNPEGNVAPGQGKTFTATASVTNTAPRTGHYDFALTVQVPDLDLAASCPHPRWTPEVVGVTFDDTAALTLYAGGRVADRVTADVR